MKAHSRIHETRPADHADAGALAAHPGRVPVSTRLGSFLAVVLPFAAFLWAIVWLWGWGITWPPLILMIVLSVLTTLGITVGFHRLFTHRSFQTTRPIQAMLAVLGSMAAEGAVVKWAAVHRLHHQHSDDPADPHSPQFHGDGLPGLIGGLWHAHLGWLFVPDPPNLTRYVPDLMADRMVRVISRLFGQWVVIGLLVPAVIIGLMTMSWIGAVQGFIWGGLVRIFMVHHLTWSINSICHLWGNRPFQTRDHSRNNPIFGVIGLGEGWHNNHHAFPTSARHGLRWWEVDASYMIIRAMAWVGLAWKVRVPAPEMLVAKRRSAGPAGPRGGDAASASGPASAAAPMRHEARRSMNPQKTGIMAVMIIAGIAVLLLGGCTMQSASETPRRIAGAQEGDMITSAELDELSRAFADRYVGLLYSVTEALKQDNPDPQQRRMAQMLLLDCATNVYDIASNADAFTRVLDLLVVTSLLHEVWANEGRAVAVFGERGEALVRATSHASAEARMLGARVLTREQLDIVDRLMLDWRHDNPDMVHVSFVRFSNFAIGRGMSAASNVLAARGALFSDIGRAGQAIDEARLMGERMFYRVKREPTLLRWQAEAVKDDLVATSDLAGAFADLHRLTDQFEKLPAHVAAERQATLDALHDSFLSADATIGSVREALADTNRLVEAIDAVVGPLDAMFRTADTVVERLTPSDRPREGVQSDPPDIRDYTEAATQLTVAADRVDNTLTTLSNLIKAPDWEVRLQQMNELADGRIMMAAEQSKGVLDAMLWRAFILLGVLFVMLMLFRLIWLMLNRRLAQPPDRHAQRGDGTGRPTAGPAHGPEPQSTPVEAAASAFAGHTSCWSPASHALPAPHIRPPPVVMSTLVVGQSPTR